MKRKGSVFAFAFLTVFAVSMLAQDLIVDVNLTMLEVFVEDEGGRAVLDLTADDFEVIENGQVRAVRHLSVESEPVAVGLAVDRSSSISSVRKSVDESVARILETAAPDDQAFLVTFAERDKVSVPMTTDRAGILTAIRKAKLGYGTRFYDAVIDSLDYLSKVRMERKALIIFSDGADHNSSHTFKQAIGAAMLYGYPIFVMGYVGDDPLTWRAEGRRAILNQFEQLANISGGKVFLPSDQTECQTMARQILEMLHYEYRLGFYSTGPLTERPDVQVRLRGQRSGRLTVRTSPIRAPLS